jgi:MYXO-CTERM domain-containing protein
VVTWAGTAAATVTPGITGTYVKVTTQSGSPASGMFTVQPGGSATWDQSSDEHTDAQLDAYINANDAKQYAFAHIDAHLPWLSAQIPVFVNETQTCNAYSNGDDIHFFVAGPSPSGTTQCSNTGRINDVLYHEFGHSLNANSFMGDANAIDGSFGEGQADTYAQTMINSSALGKGFFANMLDMPIRESNPPGKEYVYPTDINPQDPHAGGMILSGAMWDLRVALIAKYGYDAGRAKHDAIYYGIIQHAPDMPSSYAEALAANDDDGNLANGTPDQCLIQTAFSAHGLAGGTAVTGVGTPSRDGYTISVPVVAGNADCPPPAVQSATVTWQLRDDPATKGTVQLAQAGQAWTGVIPTQPDGHVVQYKVDVTLAGGSSVAYPDNPADPMYEFYVGPVTPIKCWDFETMPSDWTHSAKTGTDEWQWGPPMGTQANYDPTSAHSGSKVFGIDLGQNGGDGLYAMKTDQLALSPVVDTTGFTNVRLQYYRWLTVEDGFFDHATIQVDGTQRWANLNSNKGNDSNTQHLDREWRFQDVDLTADAADGKVQVGFELSSDEGLAFGGWTVDDVCIVGVGGAPAGGDAGVGGDAGGGGTPGKGCCSTSGEGAAGSGLLGLVVIAGLRRRKRR